MANDDKYLIISYTTCVFAQVAFAIFAVVVYTFRLLRQKRDQTTEEFITARGTAGRWRIAWSFFASAVGSWCITAPPSFAVFTGIVGLCAYAVAAGFPVLIIALWGGHIQSKYPDVCTLSDYVGRRFGPVARTLVVAIGLFNMSIALLAEYTTIGLLFKYFVGSVDYPIIIVVGILTMIYTAYGGVYISIITDQAQGVMTALFIGILTIYTAVTFRTDLPPLTNDGLFPLAANKFGYSALYSMPCSLMAATVFSEAMWQKVWASESRQSVVFGGAVGFGLITVAVFLFGFGGWLAAWAGYVTYDTNYNLYLFQVFASERPDGVAPGASTQVASWVGVITLIVAATMNESAIDSLQNGITAVFANHFFKGQHTLFPRLVVVAVNIPLMIIALQGYAVLSLFLITNMLTTCCFLLLALGLWEGGKKWITEGAVCFGFAVALLTVTAYGIGDHWEERKSVSYGAWYTWYGNVTYDWDYFLVASMFSLVGLIMWVAGAQALRMLGVEGPGVSGVLHRLPGFDFITGGGFKRDLMTLPGMRSLARSLRYDPEAAAAAAAQSEAAASAAKGYPMDGAPAPVPAADAAGVPTAKAPGSPLAADGSSTTSS